MKKARPEVLKTFYQLEPNQILDFIAGLGEEPTGRVYQLNSYENRVFDIFLESGERWVAKFYRPQRWSKEAIQEEHDFSYELVESGFPIICPLQFDGQSVLKWQSIFVAIFPRVAGRNPDELLTQDFKQIGSQLALMHNIGARKKAQHRLSIGYEDYLDSAYDLLPAFISPEVANRYWDAVDQVAEFIDLGLNQLDFLRIQGDCHKGNLIFDGHDFLFVDFDDFCNGPAIQDIWMLTYSPDNKERHDALEALLNSYKKLRQWNPEELQWIEALRGLRIISYASWIAKRWSDPYFPRLFPQFMDYNYWAEECEVLEKIVHKLEPGPKFR